MHGWQLQAGRKHVRMRSKEGKLQTILLAATHAKFMFRKLLCGSEVLALQANCVLDKFEGCTAGGAKLGNSKQVSCQAL